MKKCFLFFIGLFAYCFAYQAFAFTYFQKNRSPSEIRKYGNHYQNAFGYSDKRNLHPYSKFQNPYHGNSIRNDPRPYSKHLRQYGSKRSYGYMHQQITSPQSITNPYNSEGNVYNPYHPSYPYRHDYPYNPYSKFQNPYHPQSLRNDPQYDVQYYGSDGKRIEKNRNIFKSSPFNSRSIDNPYGRNKNLIP